MDHTADMGIRGWGRTPAEAFEEIAAAMFALMVNANGIAPSKRIEIAREGGDLTELLIEFLGGLISDADLSRIVPFGAVVGRLEKVGGTWMIEAVAEGAPVDEVRDRLLVEVKAATYCGASVREREPGAWVAQCVVDL